MEAGPLIALISFILLWIGKEIYANGRQSKFNSTVSEAIKLISNRLDGMDKDIKCQNDKFNKVTTERTQYNEDHYLTIERFNECNKSTQEKLDKIEKIDLPSRLVKIEVLLQHNEKAVENLSSKLERLIDKGE
jgi:hypothetical protein